MGAGTGAESAATVKMNIKVIWALVLGLLCVTVEAQKGGAKGAMRGRGKGGRGSSRGSSGGSHHTSDEEGSLGDSSVGVLAGQNGMPRVGICFLRKLHNLPPLELKWGKPCVGLCYLARKRGQSRESIQTEAKKQRQRKPCVGLCYLNKLQKKEKNVADISDEDGEEEDEEDDDMKKGMNMMMRRSMR